MSHSSARLTRFIKTEFKELIKKKNNLHLSKKGISVIGKLYDLIVKADKSFHSNQKHIQIENMEVHLKQEEIQIDSFIPREIVAKIKAADRFQQKCKILHNGDTYNIKFVYPIIDAIIETKTRIQRFFQDAIYKIYLWLYVADKYASKYCSSIMNLHFYFTDHMKRLGSIDLEALDMIHVNTAFTSSCSKETDIYLFRREEWFKVFIHETFHNLGFDFSEMDCSNIDKQMNTLFPLNNTFKIYESYCEMWAETIHILFLLFFKGYDKKDALVKFETVLQYETVYSVFQCVKMLNHYQITYDQLTNKNCPISKKAREKYKEKSPVFSYYVIKTIFLLSWNDFMEWCLNNNPNLLQFNKTSTTQMSFFDLIYGLHKSERVLKNIAFMENWFKLNKRGNHDPYIMLNMRMTLNG
jgi:hypothetical protein